MKKYLLGLFIVLTTTFIFTKPLQLWAEERYTELQNFTKILNLVQQYYVEPVDTKKLIAGAIKGMLRELDPHTNYMPVEIFKDFESETAGEFGGIGIEISVQNGILTIISPIEDTPAWKAGIKAGDKIVSIDNQSTKGFSLVEASALLKGKRGEPIVLSVVRENVENPIDIKIVRGQVKIKSVKSAQLDDGYLYVRITSFIENTSKELEKVLADYSANHKNKFEGILIDLRRNPGGLLDQAIKISDLFLKEGVIVSTIGRDPKTKEVNRATGKALYPDIPIVILVNEYSASASEIVSGALQDNKRAVIVGERSFGKGSVQSVIKLGDGSGLKLTVARYYTPSGVSIQSEGITPDIEIEDVNAEIFAKAISDKKGPREKDIIGHLKGEKEKLTEKLKDKKSQTTHDNALAWWKDIGSKKDSEMTEKEKLFKTDYQAYQAYSYLKAWKTLKNIK